MALLTAVDFSVSAPLFVCVGKGIARSAGRSLEKVEVLCRRMGRTLLSDPLPRS